MQNLEEKYNLFEKNNTSAENGGGDEKILKQHQAGKKTAR